jgi:hypothetical protein
VNELRALDITIDIWDRIKFYPRLWFHRAFICPRGKHSWRAMYITDGRTEIWPCIWCDATREPTLEEIQGHPDVGLTPQQLARRQEQIEKAEQWLKENGFS